MTFQVSSTVGRMDAAVELTGTYLQRVEDTWNVGCSDARQIRSDAGLALQSCFNQGQPIIPKVHIVPIDIHRR
jgi:hypothetical protein